MICKIDINFTLTIVSVVSIVIPLVIGLAKVNKLVKAQLILLFYVILASITEIVSTLLARNGITNLPLLHIYIPLEFAILTYFFKAILKELGVRLNVFFYIIPFIIFSILNVIFLEGIYTFNSNARSAECLFFIVLSICYLFYLSESNILFLTELPAFWGNAAILFYFGGNLFIFGYSRFFIENWMEYHPAIWNIHSFFNIGFKILLAKALWTNQKE